MKRIRTLLPIALILITLFSSSMTAHAYSTVRYGSRGTDVKTLQTMLNTVEGTNLVVDGIFGKATKNAVVSFQRKNRLTADGIAGAKTWAALEKQYNAKKYVKTASTLSIGSGRYSPDTITQGNVYSFNGTITSNYALISVVVQIQNASGQIVQEKYGIPNAKSYDIKKLDKYIRFGTLSPGFYRFVVAAHDASGNKKELVNQSFKVNSRPNQVNGSRASYAKQIYQLYQSKRISFTCGSEHKKNKDNAYALNNIKDTSNGKAASRSNYGYAPGGSVYLDPQLLKLVLDIQAKYGTLTISEIAGGSHSKGSRHYAGKAVDMTLVGGKRTAALGNDIYKFLTARGYQLVPVKAGTVLEGSSHFHIAIR